MRTVFSRFGLLRLTSANSLHEWRWSVLIRSIFHRTDGGLSDALPIDFARGPMLGATHVIASDCRSRRGADEHHDDADLVYVRPRLDDTHVLRAPRASLLEAVAAGEAAVTPDTLERISGW